VTRRIFGLDFSGAHDAGRHIWLAEGEETAAGFAVLSCRPASELPGGSIERASALAALRAFIARTPEAIIGCDFPFSLPRGLIAAADWPSFIAAFDHADAEAFRRFCCGLSPGREPKRLTDVDSKTPWCAFNIRLYRQSYHGMAELLRPLVGAGHAAALPMQPALADRAWLVETCPASVLKHLGLRGSYKGRAFRDQRRRMLRQLRDLGLLRALPAALERRVVGDVGGDALDSILAALAAAAVLRKLADGSAAGDPIEGRVYFRLRTAARTPAGRAPEGDQDDRPAGHRHAAGKTQRSAGDHPPARRRSSRPRARTGRGSPARVL
jgi:hypothetical protein